MDETGVSLHRGPVGGLSTGNFERWMKGALGMEHVSLKRVCGESLWGGGAPALGTLEDTLRKAPDMGISLHREPFTTEGNLESGGWGGSYTGNFER